MTTAAPTSNRWLFGPAPDLFLGCGLAYALVFIFQSISGDGLRAFAPIALVPLFNLLTSSPHYGATLLRAYERREDRRAYAFFTVYATLTLCAFFMWGLYDPFVGSCVLTVYLTWSPWHYSGQNYGISLMFLGRRGVVVTQTTRRLLRASFVLSFVLTIFALHGQRPVTSYAPVGLENASYRLYPLGIPSDVLAFGMNATALAYVGVIVGLVAGLLRRASMRDVFPVLCLIGTQALWFSAPALARQWGVFHGLEPFSIEYAAYAFVWIATGHSIQYLWITAYYARVSGRFHSHSAFYGKALLAGVSIWTLPALLFAPGLLGKLPYDAGLGVLVAAVVNLHHFIIDGVIWKLRDGRVARVLIRSASEGDVSTDRDAHRPWAFAAVAAAGLLSVIVTVVWVLEDEYGFQRAMRRGDTARAELAVKHLAWVGHDSPAYQLALARMKAKDRDVRAARDRVEASLRLGPSTGAWILSGRLHEAEESWKGAAYAYANALLLDPENAALNYRAGLTALQLGDRRKARRLLAESVRLDPENEKFRVALQHLGVEPLPGGRLRPIPRRNRAP